MKSKAFSIIELLLSLVIISCITAALVPVMNKRISTSVNVTGGGNSGHMSVETQHGEKTLTLQLGMKNMVITKLVGSGGGGGGGAFTENSTTSYNSYGGGSGGTGAALAHSESVPIVIPDDVISACIDGKVIVRVKPAGIGGSSANVSGSTAANGTNGDVAEVLVQNSAGTLKYGYRASGGKGGKGATASAVGAAGEKGGTCELYNGSSWTTISCTNAGSNGVAGSSKTNVINTAAGGAAQTGYEGYGSSGAGGSTYGGSASNGFNGDNGIARIETDY